MLPAVAALRRELTLYPTTASTADDAGAVSIPLPAPALSSPHLEAIYAAALPGLGIAGVPSFVAADALRDGRLERVLPGWRGAMLTLYAALPTRRHVPARTRAFVDFLLQTYGGEARDLWSRD